MRIRPVTYEDFPRIIELFEMCFEEAPWYEKFKPSEVHDDFLPNLVRSDAVFLVAEQESRIIGCTLGFDLRWKPDVRLLVGADWVGSFYSAELFVAREFRQQGIARRLVVERFVQAKMRGFRRAVVRTSVDQPYIRHLYAGFDFIEIARQDVLSVKIADGEPCEMPDRRVILGGIIPA